MRIRRVDVIAFHAPIAAPQGNGVTLWRERRAALLRIMTEDGAVGLGEAWAPSNVVDPVLAALSASAPRLLAAVDPVPPDLPLLLAAAVRSAVDVACADARSRAAGLPLWRSLGGAATVAVYGSGGLYADGKDTRALADEMAGYVAAGFRRVKMKVGALALSADLDRIAAVRSAIGDTELVVDALSRFDRGDARDAVRRYADAGAAAVQAPMPLDDIDGLASLTRESPVPIWVGETCADIAIFRRLATLPDPPWLQINPALIGGTQAIALAAALGRRTRVTLQCHATAVLQATCLHLAGACAAIAHAEFHMFHRHLNELMPAAARSVRDGCIVLGTEPGLGFDLPGDDSRLRLVARSEAGA